MGSLRVSLTNGCGVTKVTRLRDMYIRASAASCSSGVVETIGRWKEPECNWPASEEPLISVSRSCWPAMYEWIVVTGPPRLGSVMTFCCSWRSLVRCSWTDGAPHRTLLREELMHSSIMLMARRFECSASSRPVLPSSGISASGPCRLRMASLEWTTLEPERTGVSLLVIPAVCLEPISTQG